MNTENTPAEETQNQPPTDGAGGSAGGNSTPPKNNLGKWFWGTIIVLAAVTLALTIVANLQTGNDNGADTSTGNARPLKLSAKEIEKLLDDAKKASYEICQEGIDELLMKAYRPVYDRIPSYTDYHYTVWGEYVELGLAAQGKLKTLILDKIGGKYFNLTPAVQNKWQQHIQNKLFGEDAETKPNGNAFETKLNEALQEISNCLIDEFAKQVDLARDKIDTQGAGLEFVTSQTIDSATKRVRTTVPVAGTAALTSAVTLTGAASVIMKKLAAKLAAKGAAKLAATAAASAAGAGTGALLCAWAGPFATVCAIGGGVITWFGVDKAFVEIDELWNRKDFETDLRGFIDEHRAQTKEDFKRALGQRLLQIQDADCASGYFTLEGGRKDAEEICDTASDLVRSYAPFRNDLPSRNPQSISAFREKLNDKISVCPLVPLVREIQENIGESSLHVKVVRVRVTGNLPSEYRANRTVSAIFTLNDKELPLARVKATEQDGFNMEATPNWEIPASVPLQLAIKMEQHLLLRNKFFVGGSEMKSAFSKISRSAYGLSHTVTAKFSLWPNQNDEEETPSWLIGVKEYLNPGVTLNLTLQAKPLPRLRRVPRDCPP